MVAAALVAPNRRAQAIALMFTGLTLANVLGVPLGTALGQARGLARDLLGGDAASASPQPPRSRSASPAKIEMRTASLVREFGVLKNPQVLMVLGISVLASASLFFHFHVHHADSRRRDRFHAARGHARAAAVRLGLTVGSTLGGKLADWRLMPSPGGVPARASSRS